MLKNSKNPEVSIVLPCRNEGEALPYCLEEIEKVLRKSKIEAEVIVSDSSTDKSPQIARKFGAKLVKHDKFGYGNAYLEGFNAAKGKYLFLADADGTYDFKELPRFINLLKKGNDLVMGNRFGRKMKKESMTWSHRYIGNPVLSSILRIFFGTTVRDSHCGMRAISREALDKLELRTSGMEFASEMVMKALKTNLKISDIDIDYHPRIGETKLRTFRDGWRHLRFMLLYSPLFLFFIPGILLFAIGLFSMLGLYFSTVTLLGIQFYVHPMFLSSMFMLVGYQLVMFAGFARLYALTHLGDKSKILDKALKYITIEKAILSGGLVVLVGVLIYLMIFIKWINVGFGDAGEIKNSILALTFVVLGVQTIFASFMMSIIGIGER